MAKVKFSALISGMSGKLNGSVFAKNRGGAYIRNKVTPSNPSTSYQISVRAILADLAAAFRTLGQASIAAWNGAVSQWATTDVFGDLKNPSGINLYVRLNANIAKVGGTAITVPPAPLGTDLVLLDGVTADVSDSEILLDSPSNAVPAGHALLIEATPCMSAGISNANGKFRQIHTIAAGQDPNADIFVQWSDKFGALVAGQKLFVRVSTVRLATGEQSQKPTVSTVVVA